MIEKKGKLLLWLKKERKRIMISEFLILIRKLHILDFILNYQLLQDKNWLFDKNQKPCQYYIELLKYSKNHYWNENKIID